MQLRMQDKAPRLGAPEPSSEGPSENYHVIARPKAVAISWYVVRICTISQEIPTGLRPSE